VHYALITLEHGRGLQQEVWGREVSIGGVLEAEPGSEVQVSESWSINVKLSGYRWQWKKMP